MNSWECKGSKLIFLQFLFLKSFSLITSNFTNYQWNTISSETTKNENLVCNFQALWSFGFLKKLVWTPCTLISWKIGGSFSTWSAINSRVPQHSVIHSFLAPLITEQLQFFFSTVASCWCCFQIEPVLLWLLFLAFRSEKLFFFQVGHRWLLNSRGDRKRNFRI